MSAPENREVALQSTKTAHKRPKNARFLEPAQLESLDLRVSISLPLSAASYSDHP
jgi:hypothetical protein